MFLALFPEALVAFQLRGVLQVLRGFLALCLQFLRFFLSVLFSFSENVVYDAFQMSLPGVVGRTVQRGELDFCVDAKPLCFEALNA